MQDVFRRQLPHKSGKSGSCAAAIGLQMCRGTASRTVPLCVLDIENLAEVGHFQHICHGAGAIEQRD